MLSTQEEHRQVKLCPVFLLLVELFQENYIKFRIHLLTHSPKVFACYLTRFGFAYLPIRSYSYVNSGTH